MTEIDVHNLQVLVVEDDLNLGYLLMENLHDKGFKVTLAANGTEGIQAVSHNRFDLCILDIMLPGEDGFAVAKSLRIRHPETPFIFLTARNMEADRLHGFELGAEDFITKPFSFKELYYRIQVILRRTPKAVADDEPATISMGKVSLQPERRILLVNGRQSKLSQRETELLHLLLQHPNSYIERAEILKQLWGRDDYFAAKSMDVYLSRIRKLLKDDPTLEIENLYGNGYRIRCLTTEKNSRP